jgi:hypothetical protein
MIYSWMCTNDAAQLVKQFSLNRQNQRLREKYSS